MTGSVYSTDNSTTDNSTAEAEHSGVDTANSGVDENNAGSDPFLDGLGVSDDSDGDADASSDSEKEIGGDASKPKEGADQSSDKPEESQEQQKSSGRPDKRTRQIEDLSRTVAERDAEIARLRQIAEQQNQIPLPQGDEDGNLTVEQMADYNRRVAENAARQQTRELEQKLLVAEDKRSQTEARARFERAVSEATAKYKVLDQGSTEYSPEVDASVRRRVEAAIAPFQVAGSKDYHKVVEVAEAAIAEAMGDYEMIRQKAASEARGNLDSLRDSSALVSPDAGTSPDSDDDFLKGFNAN
jgi:hypothetical protein